MDIVDMAIPPVVFQKSGFHRNCDFRNFQKLDPLQTHQQKKYQAKMCLPFKDILVQEINSRFITKVEYNIIMLFCLFDSVNYGVSNMY
jgi:hypothetical protein